MNIYLIDPLNSPIEVLFDNLNKLFAIPFNNATELSVMLKKKKQQSRVLWGQVMLYP